MDIKFKCWDKHYSEMISSEEMDYYKEDDKLVSYYYAGNKHPLYENGKHVKVYCKLLQYIGTFDKKGKEIFEGDILKGGSYSGRNKNGVVVKRGHEYFAITSSGVSEGYSTEFNSMEIIGNIYENEDLI